MNWRQEIAEMGVEALHKKWAKRAKPVKPLADRQAYTIACLRKYFGLRDVPPETREAREARETLERAGAFKVLR